MMNIYSFQLRSVKGGCMYLDVIARNFHAAEQIAKREFSRKCPNKLQHIYWTDCKQLGE